jgi:hypothetical protein
MRRPSPARRLPTTTARKFSRPASKTTRKTSLASSSSAAAGTPSSILLPTRSASPSPSKTARDHSSPPLPTSPPSAPTSLKSSLAPCTEGPGNISFTWIARSIPPKRVRKLLKRCNAVAPWSRNWAATPKQPGLPHRLRKPRTPTCPATCAPIKRTSLSRSFLLRIRSFSRSDTPRQASERRCCTTCWY